MRLTNKVCIQGKLRYGCKPRLDRQYNRNETNDITNTPEIIDKLGQLEDIEEELGIDLITLLKVITAFCKQEYLWTKYDSKLDETNDIDIGDEYNGLWFIYFYWDSGKHLVFKLSDYGKTWALTKEELE